jgi:hypothetical protein
VHVVRDKDGEDIMLMIFEDEHHAKEHGTKPVKIPQGVPTKPFAGF